jgi:hypothetical protein
MEKIAVHLNKNVQPEDLWYSIGYIATDGHLSIDGRHINITSKDRNHLFSIRKALDLKNKIGRKYREKSRTKEYSQLQFGDVKFYRYLLSLGFNQKKSLNLGPISVSNEFFVDFLRGVIDGDGSFHSWIHRSNGHRQWALRIVSASEIFINWLNDRIKHRFDVRGKFYIYNDKRRKNRLYLIKFGKKAAGKIAMEIYYDGSLSLKRKRIKARLCLQD